MPYKNALLLSQTFCWFQNFAAQFQAAQAAVAEAGSAMAESATAAAQQAQQSSSRMRLDIKIKAPVVIVPQSSTNNNAIVVDLGNIAISNVFKVGRQKNKDDQVAVLDHMTITLAQLKLSRSVLPSNYNSRFINIYY